MRFPMVLLESMGQAAAPTTLMGVFHTVSEAKRRLSLLEHIQAVLSTTPERWQRLVSTLPIDLLTRPPVVGEWSALNCLQHLLDAERLLFPVRLHAFLAGQDLV